MFVLTELVADVDTGERPSIYVAYASDNIDDVRRVMRKMYSAEITHAIEFDWIDDVLNGEWGTRRDYLGIDGNTARVFTDCKHYELNIFDTDTCKLA